MNIVIPWNCIWSQTMPLLLSNTTFNTLIRIICNNNIINHRSLREKCGLILPNGVHSVVVHICIIQTRVHCNGRRNKVWSLTEVWDIHMRWKRINYMVNISILYIVIPCNCNWSQNMPLLLRNTTFNTLIRYIYNRRSIDGQYLSEMRL